ncbi:MAG: hypothetical protein AAB405_00370 [Patescibacteria group bacterium]
MFLSKKNILLFLVALVIILMAIIYWRQNNVEKPYYAVYLENGDIYFGKVSIFPYLFLSDVYFLQKNISDSQNPFSVLKFENAFWGPESKIYINREKIIWKTRLKDDSQVLNIIKNYGN